MGRKPTRHSAHAHTHRLSYFFCFLWKVRTARSFGSTPRRHLFWICILHTHTHALSVGRMDPSFPMPATVFSGCACMTWTCSVHAQPERTGHALLPRQLVRALSKLEFLLRNGLLRARGVAGDLAGRWGATLPAQQLTRRSLPESLGEVLRRLFWKPHAFLLVAPFTAPRRIVDATHPALILPGRHDRPD